MAALRGLLLVGLLFGMAMPASGNPLEQWSDLIAEASRRFGVPEAWIRRVMRAESGGRTHLRGRPITSHAGAQGLMQVMPATWRELRAAHGLGADPHDPRDNILAGTAYLRAMHDRFGYPGLFAAYNAGPGRYSQLLQRGRSLPAETVAYVVQVTGSGNGLGPAPGAAQGRRPPRSITSPVAAADRLGLLFALRARQTALDPPPVSAPPPASGLFVSLRHATRD